MENKKKYLGELKQELDNYTRKLSEIQNHFKGKAGVDVKKISKSLQNILHQANVSYEKLKSASAEEWEPMKEINRQAFENLRNSFGEFLNSSSDQVKECVIQIEKKYKEQLECTAEYIREHPIKSILLAAGLGFIIGKLLK